MMIARRETYWLDSGAVVRREDLSVLISAGDGGNQELEVFIDPSLFPALRAAMDAAEQPPA